MGRLIDADKLREDILGDKTNDPDVVNYYAAMVDGMETVSASMEGVRKMNCIKDGKYTGDSCFGCKVKVQDCEIRDKVYIDTWIPIADRLPAKYAAQRVLVTLKNKMVVEAWYINNKFKFPGDNTLRTVSDLNPVVAWMPLPTPYKEEINETDTI